MRSELDGVNMIPAWGRMYPPKTTSVCKFALRGQVKQNICPQNEAGTMN